jgi:hypothetical protein
MNMRMRRDILFAIALVVLTSLPASAQLLNLSLAGVTASVSGSSINISLSLPGVLGTTLSLSFEDVSGLSVNSLGLSGRLINPFDPAILSRLPAGTIPALPVMLRMEPPVNGGLQFNGVWNVDLHTFSLLYSLGCPFRLYSAPLGGSFNDITTTMGAGSYRARGTSGGFSEFLIIADLRTVNQQITAKLDRLEGLLDEYEGSLSTATYDELDDLLADARTDFTQGHTADAIDKVDDFTALVEAHSGSDIPDLWRAARDVDNVGGYLRAGALTLRFSLDMKRSLHL